ncbi:MAG: ABC transporter permease subunit [Clostridia bacterium]|nr:ABC transporter permease subunit [Clostridia bacterium]
MSAIFKKELRSYFTSPLGYIVLAVVFLFAGWSFFAYNMSYGAVSLSYVYNSLYTVVMLLVLPVLTMRLFSDEKRQKTDQALFTAPTSLTALVVGKFLAALLLFAMSMAITLVFAIIIATKTTPEWLVIFGNYFGIILLGGMVIAIGLLISCLTESQFIAAIGTFAISFLLILLDQVGGVFQGVEWLNKVLAFLSVNTRYTNFTSGLIRYDNIIFFLSMQALFLFLAVRVLDRKRWK